VPPLRLPVVTRVRDASPVHLLADVPTITDGEEPDPVTLRGHRPDDVGSAYEMCTDPDMQRWTTVPVPYERQHAEDFVFVRTPRGWADGTEWGFAVEARDDAGLARFAGNVALRLDGAGGAEVAYALAPWARGRGVMSRAVRLLLTWGFTERGLQVVHWRANVGNWPSRRVAWATGFRLEGTVRGLLAARGQLHDGWVGSVVRGEPLQPATAWLEVPELHGRGVVLRRWREDDVPRVAEACADPRTQAWLPALPSPYTLADAQWYVGSREEQHARGSGIYWCVAAAEDDRCVGSIGLMNLGEAGVAPEIGYWTHPDARRRGLMTTATRLVLRHAVLDVEEGGLGLPRVTLRAATANAASNAVAVGAGLTRTGIARSGERLRDGTLTDMVLYDALATEVGAEVDAVVGGELDPDADPDDQVDGQVASTSGGSPHTPTEAPPIQPT
jgi:ribosomal-protein-alanine N-acetyltransferase